MRKAKRFTGMLLAVLLILSMAGCGGKANTPDDTADSIVSETGEESTPSTELDDIAAARKKLYDEYTAGKTQILFIGHSLIYSGKMSEAFEALCKANDQPVIIKEMLAPAASLTGWVSEITKRNDRDEIDKIVLIKGPGDEQTAGVEAIEKIKAMFPETTRFYYLWYEGNVAFGFDLRLDLDYLTYVPYGYAHNDLINNKGFIYEQLHIPDGHPNALYGYLAALCLYSVVFDTSCLDINAVMLEGVERSIPGETEEERQNNLKLIQEAAEEASKIDVRALANPVVENNIEAVGEFVRQETIRDLSKIYVNVDPKKVILNCITKYSENGYAASVGYKIEYDQDPSHIGKINSPLKYRYLYYGYDVYFDTAGMVYFQSDASESLGFIDALTDYTDELKRTPVNTYSVTLYEDFSSYDKPLKIYWMFNVNDPDFKVAQVNMSVVDYNSELFQQALTGPYTEELGQALMQNTTVLTKEVENANPSFILELPGNTVVMSYELVLDNGEIVERSEGIGYLYFRTVYINNPYIPHTTN